MAVIGATRADAFPDVPTAAESGYTEAVMDVCVGVFGPPKMPESLVRKIEEALGKAVSDPEFQKQAEKLGSNIVPLQHAEFKAMVEKIYKQTLTVKDEMLPKK